RPDRALRSRQTPGALTTRASPTISCPWLLAFADALAHLGLERGRPERVPFLFNAIEQQAAVFLDECLEPIERPALGLGPDRDSDIHPQPVPAEIRGQQDHVCLIGSHPIGQGACMGKPTANEGATGVVRARLVDRAVMTGAERARRAGPDIVTADVDPQPAVATGGAGAALPVACDRHQPPLETTRAGVAAGPPPSQ